MNDEVKDTLVKGIVNLRLFTKDDDNVKHRFSLEKQMYNDMFAIAGLFGIWKSNPLENHAGEETTFMKMSNNVTRVGWGGIDELMFRLSNCYVYYCNEAFMEKYKRVDIHSTRDLEKWFIKRSTNSDVWASDKNAPFKNAAALFGIINAISVGHPKVTLTKLNYSFNHIENLPLEIKQRFCEETVMIANSVLIIDTNDNNNLYELKCNVEEQGVDLHGIIYEAVRGKSIKAALGPSTIHEF